MNRRKFLVNSALTGAGLMAWIRSPSLSIGEANASDDKDTVTIVQFSDSGEKLGPARVKKLHKTDAEWKQQLTPLQFEVTRKAGTERAFSGEYNIHD
ncbi:MAG: peptide-methionine (R)-S-oxide reductase, partial [Terriglobales bacterium]